MNMESQRGILDILKEKKPLIIKSLKILGILILIGILAIVGFILSIKHGAFGALPSHNELANIKNHLASEIYTEDGVLMGKYFIENRASVSLDATSPHVVDALVATEDARFFRHSGVDYRSLLRVLFKTILGGDQSAGGGSTLSQQLAKNLYPRKNSIPISKIKEMFVASHLERIYNKEEILTLYLNTVSFGEDVYGIHVASERYFNTTPDKLKTEEAAVLVGMLKATTTYNPRKNPDKAIQRRNVVLDQMVNYGKISRKAGDILKESPLNLNYHLISRNFGLAPYFREHIRLELRDWVAQQKKPDGTPYNLYTDGLKIHTTIHSKMQKFAEEAVSTHMKSLQEAFDSHWKGNKPWGDDSLIEMEKKKTDRYKKMKAAGYSEKEINKSFNTPVMMTLFDWEEGQVQKKVTPLDSLKFYFCLLNTGFLAAEPQTGKIKAWVGGTNFRYFQYDHVKSKRQVGSTFKPIVYATGLSQGYTPCDYFYNRLVTYTEWDDWEPQNSDGVYGGMLSMMGGLTNSVNTITVDMIMKTGIPEVVEMAKSLGIESEIPEYPSIALGTANISLFEMIQVYATFANKGIHSKPKYLLKIEDAKGNLIGEFIPKDMEELEQDTTQVLSEEDAIVMTKMLENVVNEGTGRRLRFKYGFEGDIAGKTGTTQLHADGWFMGYTPNMVAGAWVGGENPRIHFRDISLGQGANMALPIWAEFMKRVYAEPEFSMMEMDTFPEPSIDLMVEMTCPPKITENEYIAMQNPDPEPEVIVPDPTDPKDITIIKNPTRPGGLVRPGSEGGGKGTIKTPSKPSRPGKPVRPGTKSKRELEKEAKRKRKEEKKKKRRSFFKDLFD